MKFLFRKLREKSALRESSVPVAPPTQGDLRAPVAAAAEKPPAPAIPKEECLFLEFADFLGSIPLETLRPGAVSFSASLVFDLREIGRCLFQGETTIPLAELVRQVPDAFDEKVSGLELYEIRFPWQKVFKLINESAQSEGEPQGESLLTKLRRHHGETKDKLAVQLDAEREARRRAGRGGAAVWFSRGAAAPYLSENRSGGNPERIPTDRGQSKSAGAPTARTGPQSADPATTTAPQEPPAASLADESAAEPSIAPQAENPLPAPDGVPSTQDPALLIEELGRARDAALHRAERLQAEHNREIAVLRHEKEAAFEYANRHVAQVQADAKRRVAELEALLEAAREGVSNPEQDLIRPPSRPDAPEAENGQPCSSPPQETSGEADEVSANQAQIEELKMQLVELAARKESEIAAVKLQNARMICELTADKTSVFSEMDTEQNPDSEADETHANEHKPRMADADGESQCAN